MSDLSEKNILGVPGLTLARDVVSSEEAKLLLVAIDEMPWNTSLKRRTQHYGYTYDYTSREAAEVAAPIPDAVRFLVERLLSLGLLLSEPDQMIVNEYLPGQGIAAHVDSVHAFADGVASVSLGSPVTMEFARRGVKKETTLPTRSAIVLHGHARYGWTHAIPARKMDHGVPRTRRVSLTFRTMLKTKRVKMQG